MSDPVRDHDGPLESAPHATGEFDLPAESSHAGTVLGLPLPAASSAALPKVSPDSAPQLRSTRPAWIDRALAELGEPGAQRARISLVPGAQIPGTRYRIDRWIGDGGMGQVFEATHIDLERRVAVKVLRAEASTVAEAIQMFRDEARRAGKIGSQYIAEVYDFAELPDGRLMFAMELLEGRSIASELRRGPVPPGRAIGLLRQVCKGLHAAHRAKIIHRDVKPENLMLTDAGRKDMVKILDFGISTVYDDAQSAAGSTAGTAHYIAPELVSGVPYGPKVDMYALGCTAYEMLTGETPFESDSIEGLLLAHVEQAPPPMARRNPAVEVPALLEAVVLRCMAKQPARRYANMAELEAALCEAQIDADLHTTWDDLPLPEIDDERRAELMASMPDPQRALFARRRWLWPVATALSVTLALGLGVVAFSTYREAPTAPSQVDDLAHAARDAAAQAIYVYPPPDDPAAETAYGRVLALEDLRSREAKARASELRDLFAATLTRLGDQYWERPGGKPFALDYYAQALLFDPAQPQATLRAQLTPGQLAILGDKAARGDFSEGELIAAEPLAALADADETRRLERVEALIDRGGPRSMMATESLDTLLVASGRPPTGSPRRARNEPGAADPGQGAGAPSEVLEDLDEDTGAQEEDEEEASVGSEKADDPARSRRLARLGWSALGSGRLAEAEPRFEEALAASSKNADAHAGLAKIAFDRANYAQALRHAKKAVRYAPGDAEHRIRLGDSYYKLYRYGDALVHYERAAQIGHAGAPQRVEKARSKLGRK